MKNPLNNYPLLYYPISKVENDDFLLLSYYTTDGYQIDAYITSFSKQNNSAISTLHVKEYIATQQYLYAKIDSSKEIITITKFVQIEVDSTIEVKEVYKSNADFPLVSRSSVKQTIPGVEIKE